MKADILESKRLILRPIQLKDSEAVIKLATKDAAKYFGAIPFPCKIENAKKWIRSTFYRKNSVEFAITLKDTNNFIGYIEVSGINAKSKVGCISYWTGKKYWGKGFMAEASSLVLNYVFKSLELKRIYAQVNGGNIASRKLLEKLGFKLEGKLRNHIFNRFTKEIEDKLFYGLLINEWIK